MVLAIQHTSTHFVCSDIVFETMASLYLAVVFVMPKFNACCVHSKYRDTILRGKRKSLIPQFDSVWVEHICRIQQICMAQGCVISFNNTTQVEMELSLMVFINRDKQLSAYTYGHHAVQKQNVRGTIMTASANCVKIVCSSNKSAISVALQNMLKRWRFVLLYFCFAKNSCSVGSSVHRS